MTTEKRLIYMDETMDKLIAYAERKHQAGHAEIANGILKAVNYIHNGIRRVDAVEVVHSEWHNTSFTTELLCLNCFEISYIPITRKGRKTYNYCPNCGAKMDGERRT